MKPEDILRKDYGNGVYRRHIWFDLETPGVVRAALEDEAHAFEVSFRYADGKVTDIDSKWNRHPTTTCPGAVDKLQEVVGHELTGSVLDLKEATDPVENCTHFFDVTSHMAAHAKWLVDGQITPEQRLYRMFVSDAVEGKQEAELRLGDDILLHWQIEDGVIVSPTKYAGRAVLKGMVGWARDNLDQVELMHALMLQKCFFVSVARKFRIELLKGFKCKDGYQPIGTCYATRGGREEVAERTGNRLDYSQAEERILQFVER